MSDFIHFLNGQFVTEDKLLVSPKDLGFARGFAVHDFLVTHNKKPFKLQEHIDRLYKSAEIIGLKIPWNKTQIIEWVKETLEKNDKEIEKTVKIFLTGGIAPYLNQSESPTIIIMINQYIPLPSSYYENGVKAKTVKYKRPYPEAKTTFYIEGVRQFSNTENRDITQIIYYDDKQVFEGAGENLFAVINGKLTTPKSNILQGITRNVLLEILKDTVNVEVRDFTIDELLNATEAFVTGSSKGVRGVIEINGKPVGSGKVGNITKEVMKRYQDYIANQQ